MTETATVSAMPATPNPPELDDRRIFRNDESESEKVTRLELKDFAACPVREVLTEAEQRRLLEFCNPSTYGGPDVSAVDKPGPTANRGETDHFEVAWAVPGHGARRDHPKVMRHGSVGAPRSAASPIVSDNMDSLRRASDRRLIEAVDHASTDRNRARKTTRPLSAVSASSKPRMRPSTSDGSRARPSSSPAQRAADNTVSKGRTSSGSALRNLSHVSSQGKELAVRGSFRVAQQ